MIGVSSTMAALAGVVAMLVVGIMLVLEHRRSRPERVPVPRRVATVVLGVALLLLVLEPGSMRWIDTGRAWVATPGANGAAETSAMGRAVAAWPAKSAFRLTSDPVTSGGEEEAWVDQLPNVDTLVPVPDPAVLARGHADIARWVVLGQGLPPWTTMASGGPRIEAFVPAPFAPGVRQIAWTRNRVLGQAVVVEGTLAGTVPRPGTLHLLDDGGVADAWPVPEAAVLDDVPFVLQAVPRTEGRHRLRLRYVIDDNAAPFSEAIRIEETMDVTVTRSEGLDVLWWSAAPSFEIRPFRDWLVAQGGSMVSRAGLTRTRHRVALAGPEAERLSEPGLGRLSTALLAGFDVAVFDVASVGRLRADERVALRAAVEDDGLGVLIRWSKDNELPSRLGTSELAPLVPTLTPLADLESLSARVSWPGTTLDLPLILAPRQLARGVGVAPLVHDASDRLLVGARVLGRGTVGWSLVDGTYRWVLAGHAESHQAFWSRVMGQLARPTRALRWLPPSQPILVDHPSVIHLTVLPSTSDTETKPVVEIRGAGEVVRVQPRRVDETTWAVHWWPRETGWHQLSWHGLTRQGVSSSGLEEAIDSDAVPLDLDVQSLMTWRTWQHGERHRATEALMAVPEPEGRPAGERLRRYTRWPRGWAFALFLLAVGYLWLDERRPRGPRRRAR